MEKRLEKKKNTILLSCSILLAVIAFFVYFDYNPEDIHKKEITIGAFSDSFWEVQNGYSYKILNNAIKEFENEHPEVEIKYTSGILKSDYSEWLTDKILSEDAPDLFFVLPEDFNNLAELNALTDLTPYIKKEGPDFSNGFYSSAYAYGQYDNYQYALPYECAPKLMFVNQSILNKEGIQIPQENWTWEDFYRICQQVTRDTDGDNIIDQFGVVGYSWEDAFDSNGIKLFSNDGKQCFLSSENSRESIKFIEKLQEIGKTVNNRDFDLGNVVFKPMSFSEFRAYQPYPLSIKKYSNFQWSCIPMPSGPNGENISTLECLQLGINSKSHNKNLAWEFLKYLTVNPKVQEQIFAYSEGVSVLKSVTEVDQTLGNLIEATNSSLTQKILSDAVENAIVRPRFRDYALALNQVDLAVNSILKSNSNIDMELVIWNRSINKSLKEQLVE